MDRPETTSVRWTVTLDETSYFGVGEAQLCLIKGDTVVKSMTYKTFVVRSCSSVTPTEPPPDTLIEQAVNDYIARHVDVVTVSDSGEDGQLLQSNGDGTYSWLTVTDPLVSSDTGETLVPTRALNRLARAIRQKTGYEGDMTVETMAEVLEQTDMWTTEEYCLNLAPAAAELTITLGAIPAYAFNGRQNISKVVLPYCGKINTQAFSNSSISIIHSSSVTVLAAYAFNNCTSLANVELPNLINIEGTNCFTTTAISNIDLPKLKTIHSAAFGNCYSLTEVNLPELENTYNYANSVDNAFQNCRVLKRITLPKFEGVFRTGWFDGCYDLQEAIFPKLKQITTNYNFRNCYALEKLYAPECTVWTGTQNFSNCNSLRRMCFYTKPTSISNTLFSGAPVLQDIYVSWSQNEVAGAPWGAPAGCTVHYDTVYDDDGEPI